MQIVCFGTTGDGSIAGCHSNSNLSTFPDKIHLTCHHKAPLPLPFDCSRRPCSVTTCSSSLKTTPFSSKATSSPTSQQGPVLPWWALTGQARLQESARQGIRKFLMTTTSTSSYKTSHCHAIACGLIYECSGTWYSWPNKLVIEFIMMCTVAFLP